MAELLKSNCLRGCLFAAAVIVLFIAAGVVMVVLKIQQLEFAYYREAILGNIEISSLPDDTKKSVEKAFATIEQQGRGQNKAFRKINDALKPRINPGLFAAGLCSLLSDRIIPSSGLAEEEKADAQLQVRRLYAAASALKIDQKDFGEIVKIFPRENDLRIKTQLTDQQLRRAVSAIKSVIDQAAPDSAVADRYDYSAPLIALAQKIMALAGLPPATRPADSQPASIPASL